MNRTLLLGPEVVLGVFTALFFWFCSRYHSAEGRDLDLIEKLIWLLPFIVVPIAFATLWVPGSKTWWWLVRAILSSYVVTLVCGFRVVECLGSGSKGQDVAIILQIMLGSVAVAIASAIAGAMILAHQKPSFALWFENHKVLGSFLTLLSAVPLGFGLGTVVTFTFGILLAAYCEIFKR